ncbi:unnamed protein product [Allacma fusca]|uniref:Uncharacterized protein n=1 Tax=Allacma fusca TaxID=39272 RepID=A0A8J2PSI5_9HEXA|nr:unnamed protein product [Allacma fusca]
MDPVPLEQHDPVKEVEVTAKQIVDRINSNRIGTSPGERDKKDRPLLKRVSLSSTYGDQDGRPDGPTTTNAQPDGDSIRENSGAEETESVSAQDLLPELTEHEKKAQVLLTAVTKWLGESGLDSSEKSFSGSDLISSENFHWVYSIESYIRSLSWSSQKALTNKISNLIVSWHKQLFHFKKEKQKEDDLEYNRVLAHWDVHAGTLAVVKWNLYTLFPGFLTKGFETFAEDGKRPVIYCSNESVGHAVATKIGLPQSFVSVLDTQDPEWLKGFEKSIIDHDKNNQVPLALIINVDAKSIIQGCRLAEVYNIWVHLFGDNVMPYLICRPENSQIGSSFTLDVNKWTQNPVLPYLTFYKNPVKSEAATLELCELSRTNSDVMIFAPWFIVNVLGHDEVRNIVTEATSRGKFIYDLVRKYKCLQIVPNWSELSDGNVIVTSLTFQYNPASTINESKGQTAEGEPEATEDEARPTKQYVDTLNSWLYHIMDRDLKEFVPVEFVNSESGGWNVQIDVVRCPKFEPEDKGVISSLIDNHLSVLQSTVVQKVAFSRIVQDAQELEWIDHESQWAGLGAVRYVPTFHRKKRNGTSDGEDSNDSTRSSSSNEDPSAAGVKENIDHLNAQIVDRLKAIDSAFSLGESSNGEWCVQFGMVTMETDVKELVRLVISSGQEIEESSEFLNRMSELVKQGIVRATEELRRESEEALWEEGILRRVPVVGTFVNWLSPPSKETGVRGRALNLTQGKVESTENIYKYHMQVDGPPPHHGSSNN